MEGRNLLWHPLRWLDGATVGDRTEWWCSFGSSYAADDGRGMIVGHMNALNEPGEWHWQGNILFSNPANREVRSDGTLKLSEDDGRTWTKSCRYAKKPAPNFTGYSDIAVMPDGSVGVLYERGDLTDTSRKAERYDEVGFTAVPFSSIRTPLPPAAAKEATK